MKLSILCEDSKIKEARENAKNIIGPNPLKIGVSETGKSPATHWFCCLDVTEEGYNTILSKQEHTIIEKMGPKEFLDKWKLKIIK